jgi:Tfp pilus assembly protein PilF
MLADMLLLSGKDVDALHQYELSLKSDPNRFNGLMGAARAAEQSGQRKLAMSYYRTLLANSGGATDPALTTLGRARAMISVWSGAGPK